MAYAHLFGPVPSRRLGKSLGVDLTPFKTCTLDCVYCECGITTNLTLDRKPYVHAADVISELDTYLEDRPVLDHITFSGAGEPTLNSEILVVLNHIKTRYPQYAVALLTNATLFHLPEVRTECLGFDLVCPSLDAVSDGVFAKINRHHQGLDNRKIIDGLVSFSKSFTGKLWLEIFIVPGVNDTPRELALFKQVLAEIRMSAVQLNSLDRPAAYDGVCVPTRADLQRIAEYLKPLPVEIISRTA